jgi:hypothetical protein
MFQTALSPSWYSLPSHGSPHTCKYSYGVPANITQAPLSRTVVGRPFAAALNGHVIIQWGPIGIAGLVRSAGFVLLLCVAPHSMYIIPGAIFVGLGFPCMASIIHCMPIGFMHIGGAPILFSSPGVQTHSFDPFASMIMLPSAAISATVASLVTTSGPDRCALRILGSSALSAICESPPTASFCSGYFGSGSPVTRKPGRAIEAWPANPASEVVAAMVVAMNSRRVLINVPRQAICRAWTCVVGGVPIRERGS